MNRSRVVVVIRCKLVQGCVDGLSILYDVKKIKETNEENVKVQSIIVHITSFDGDYHDISGIDFIFKLSVPREPFLKALIMHSKLLCT